MLEMDNLETCSEQTHLRHMDGFLAARHHAC